MVADAVIEAARDGLRLREAVDAGRQALNATEVMDGVAALVPEVWVEAVFDDGSRLVVVPEPFGSPNGRVQPGAVDPYEHNIDAAGPAEVQIEVENTSDVPISVTSHYHFFEVNPRLRFDRAAAYGMRLAIEAGEALRFDPNGVRSVGLTRIGGARVAIGFAGLVDGPLDGPGAKDAALAKARATGFLDTAEGGAK